MTSLLKDLPLGTQSFKILRKNNFLYADKTKHIYQLLKSLRIVFLSRPRRFGKSLLLNTMEELFLGHRKLFKGLWINSSDYDFQKHPVIRLNMNYGETGTPKKLKTRIARNLKDIGKKNNILDLEGDYDEILCQLVERLREKDGSNIVVLVDEYDAPIIDHMANQELANANSKVLHNFYRTLKNIDQHLHFVFVTGITRFALTALDSGPNQFDDISLVPEYADICGFTHKDLDQLFSDRMEETLLALKASNEINSPSDVENLREMILSWYDGYNWTGEKRILNPFSILKFFKNKSFDTYWYQSGTPAHLLALIHKNPLEYIQPRLDSYLSSTIRKADFKEPDIVPILFHSGYLTIDKVSTISHPDTTREKIYSFRLPNLEIKRSYNQDCFKTVFGHSNKSLNDYYKDFYSAFIARDASEIQGLTNSLLLGITYHQHIKEEKYYHSLMHIAFRTMGFEIYSEMPNAQGRSDIALFLSEKVYVVIGLKYVKTISNNPAEDRVEKAMDTALEKALDDIRKNDYSGLYQRQAKEIIEMGLVIYDRDQVKSKFI